MFIGEFIFIVHLGTLNLFLPILHALYLAFRLSIQPNIIAIIEVQGE